MSTERQDFEATFSAPPYEFSMDRWPDNHRSAWPGNYRRYNVQCAWEGFQAGRAARPSTSTSTDGAQAGFWDHPGPQITEPEHGPEPTLREVIRGYYIAHDMSQADANRCTEQYIAAASLKEHP